MLEKFKSKRVIFKTGQQKRFIEESRKILGLSNQELSRLLHISNRTLSDWKREKFNMSLGAVTTISRKTGRKIPEGIKIMGPFWYVKKGGRIGGIAVYKKYGVVGGDPEKRKQKWLEWWERDGKFRNNPIFKRKSIRIPKKSKKLAEFVGIVLGDGGISDKQVTITLNSRDDKEYSTFVIRLIKNLFGVKPSLYHDSKYLAMDIVVSRTKLVKFCTESLGLKKGNKIKQQIDIPDWIKKNKKFSIVCLRGLIDTDGSVFVHRYRVKEKWYSYKKLSFTSYSKPLRRSVYEIMKSNGLNPRLSKNRDVRLDSVEDIKKFFDIIGSSNPKHLKRYKN